MKIDVYLGKPLYEKRIGTIDMGDHQYWNCIVPRKGDVISLNEKEYKVKMVHLDFDEDTHSLFVEEYIWGD